MCSEHEVLTWFKQLDGAERIVFLCNIFSCCFPAETEYFITYLTGTQLEANRGTFKFNTTLWTLDDPVTRSEIVISVAFLKYDNKESAQHIYEFFVRRCPKDWTEIVSDETRLKQVELILTLAVNHPAFSFMQKCYFAELLERLNRAKREIMNGVHVPSEAHTDTPADSFSPSPVEEQKVVPLEDTPAVSLLNECRDILQKDSASEPKDQKENLPDKKPHTSSPSKVYASDLLKNQMCSYNSIEATSSLLKENANDVLQGSSASSPLEDTGSIPVKEQSFNPPENNTSVIPVKEQQYSSQLKGSTDIMHVKEKSSSPTEENISSQEKLSSSSLEGKESADSENLPAASSAILNRVVARHSGKIRNLELKRNGKKGAYRIEVTWACKGKTEIMKTSKELKEFQQKVRAEMASDSSSQKATNRHTAPLPGEYLAEQYTQHAAFLSDFLTLPLSVRDNEDVVNFFQSSSSRPPRPILVGQGNIDQSPLVGKPNTVPPNYVPYKNRNNGKRTNFPERQFKSSWNFPSNPHLWNPASNTTSWNSHRNNYSYNNKAFRQEKFKRYPPISGFSSSCSSQNSQSGSSQNSRASSPGGVESGFGTKNLVRSNTKNDQYAVLQSEIPKTKPDNVRNQYLYDKEHNGIPAEAKIVVLCNK